MSFLRRGPAQGLVADSDHAIGSIYLGAKYAKVLGFTARNYASSAKASGGTDTAQKVKLTDANGIIFYLDAADDDYTAGVTKFFRIDDTLTGLGLEVVDGTGAALAAAGENVVMTSPVTVTILNGATATDYFELYLYVDIGQGGSISSH